MTIGVVHTTDHKSSSGTRCDQRAEGAQNGHYKTTVDKFIDEAYNTANEFTNCAKCDATLTDCDHINATEV